MAIDFPNSPNNGDSFTSNDKTWQYNGTSWVVIAGSVSIDAGSVTASKLANNAVTSDKIAAGAVTAAKLGNDISLTPPDGSVTQAKLAASLSGVTVTTTANRSTAVPSPFTGQLVFLTDVKRMQVWDGSAWMFMTVGVPDAPTSLSATPLSTTSVSVGFTAGSQNGSIISNYKYALSTNGGSTYSEYAALDPADAVTPITISGLTGATTYHIKLKAVADFGDSVESSAVSVTTLTPPGAPTSLSATVLSGTSVSIAFTAGATGGSAFTNMEYALSTNSGVTYGAYTAFSPADYTTPVVISGLTNNTQYTIKLRHVTTAGTGPDSSAVTITTPIDVDYLVVAGGGSGGSYVGGGGGAGGLRSTVTATGGGGSLETTLLLNSSNNYAVVIGGGGAAALQSQDGFNGNTSSFSTISTVGGGRGRVYADVAGIAGGSGGGSGGFSGSGAAGGAGTANQGYAGGATVGGRPGSFTAGGGGGGAGGVGETSSNALGRAGNGGIGVATSITGSSLYFAGGGGGGSYLGGVGGNGGLGGGGGGSTNSASAGGSGGGSALNAGSNGQTNADPSTAGSAGANTGGGGGGVGHNGTSGAGGSGVVILRYPSSSTITLGAGLTGTTTTVGSNKVTTITSGSGNVSWT